MYEQLCLFYFLLLFWCCRPLRNFFSDIIVRSTGLQLTDNIQGWLENLSRNEHKSPWLIPCWQKVLSKIICLFRGKDLPVRRGSCFVLDFREKNAAIIGLLCTHGKKELTNQGPLTETSRSLLSREFSVTSCAGLPNFIKNYFII
jgi:hypothetical protein